MKKADAYLVVYSMTDRASFRWAVSFVSDVMQHADDVTAEERSDAADLPAVILVANKADLVRKRQVSASGQYKCCFRIKLKLMYAVSTNSIAQ